MKTNWPEVVDAFKHAISKNFTIVGTDRAHTRELRDYFRMVMRTTDTFHPYTTDGDLDHSFATNDKDQIRWALEKVYDELKTNINNWFLNPYEHPPCYVMPKKIIWKKATWELSLDTVDDIIKAARSKVK